MRFSLTVLYQQVVGFFDRTWIEYRHTGLSRGDRKSYGYHLGEWTLGEDPAERRFVFCRHAEGGLRCAKSITLETFAFVRAPVTRRFSRSLAERARAGVEVKLILDAVGSRRAGEENLRVMREAGVEVRLFHPMNVLRPWHSNNRTHRKILVVDGKVAFTGGAGFAQAWQGDALTRKEWRDTQYEIRGPAVAGFPS